MRSLIGFSLFLVLAVIAFGVYIGQDTTRGFDFTFGNAQPLPIDGGWIGWIAAGAIVGIMLLIRHYRHQTELPRAQRRPHDC